MRTGRGGMGSHKHIVSGTPGPNRRSLQALGRLVSRIFKKKPKSRQGMIPAAHIHRLWQQRRKEKQ